jgi:hypothetical protein
MAKNKQSLAQISRKIKALEKNSIKNAIEIGKLLHEAYEQCDHGEYMKWLDAEFSWSHQTSLRYRSIYNLTQNQHGVDFNSLNISLTALYLVARMKDDGEQVACKAIINTAKRRRVTYRIAHDIIAKLNPSLRPPPPSPPIELPPIGPRPIEPLDDDLPSDPNNPDDENELAAALRTVLRYSECSAAWPKAIQAIGGRVKLQEIIETEKSVYEKHCGKDAIQAKADRAEAKAAQRARMP